MSSGAARQSARRTCSSQTPSPLVRSWQSDAEYIAAQDKDSSWNHETDFGRATGERFVEYGRILMALGRLFHNDRVVDFGGNDGYAANEFFKALAIKPTVIDCEPKRLVHASAVYKLPVIRCFLEDMSAIPDKSFDWAYCSHTLEHTRDPGKALREMARLTRFACLFCVPIEDDEHKEANSAHAFHLDTAKEWVALIAANGWKVIKSRRPIPCEAHVIAEPR